MRAAVRALVALVAIVVLVAAAAAWQIFGARSAPGDKHVIVSPGSSFHAIARQLQGAGVVRSSTAFVAYAKLIHADRDVHAGEFRFAGGTTAADVLRELQSGGAQIAKWVTIPEGFTAREVAERLASEGLGSENALRAWFSTHSVSLDGQSTKNLEGYLFPSTYLVPLAAAPPAVSDILTNQFRKELPPDAATRARALHLTVPEVVTVASLVEGEAKADDERPLMAGVYYNRLRIGMPLQVDATLEYAFPVHKTVVTKADLQLDSPYNSYKFPGLPPTPINNPGAASLHAAFFPKSSPFLYYVYRGDGHHAFARTLAEHQANVAKYLK